GAYDSDALFPAVQSFYVRIVAALRQALASRRRVEIDSDQPWVAVNRLDGGDVRYLALSGESGAYPWQAGAAWSLGAEYNRDPYFAPVRISGSAASVVYDLFTRRVVPIRSQGARSSFDSDLSAFLGGFFAVARRPIATPALSVDVGGARASYHVNVG